MNRLLKFIFSRKGFNNDNYIVLLLSNLDTLNYKNVSLFMFKYNTLI